LADLGLDSIAKMSLLAALEDHFNCRIDSAAFLASDALINLGDLVCAPKPLAPKISTMLQRYEIANQRTKRMRDDKLYFYESMIENVVGPSVTVAGKDMLMLASYNYLGLLNRPETNTAMLNSLTKFGTGVHGVRLLAGTTQEHLLLEAELAKWHGYPAAAIFNTGYQTNLSVIGALAGPGDLIIADEFVHASLHDGIRFSGASAQLIHHNSLVELEHRLESAPRGQTLVIVDAVYSMEGDICPLPQISELCRRFEALLMVDEAHSIGVLGSGGGILQHFGLNSSAIDVLMGTLSKGLCSTGGYVAANREIIEYLKHNARGYIFSSAIPAPQIAAARASIQYILGHPEISPYLRELTQYMRDQLTRLGFRVGGQHSAIIPLFFDTQQQTLQMTKLCREKGLFVVPVFYPAVPENAPRIRLSLMASLTKAHIDKACAIISEAWSMTSE
jgi:8-amino-7-oxononanoate synthase